MPRLFVSHSSANNDKAVEVRDWLAKNGWDDVFLDLDPARGIVAGQRWKDALQKAAYHCEVVLALVSKEWLASGWCKSEIDAARLMGKKIIVALIGVDKGAVPLDLTDEQFIDLTNDPQAYRRLKEGLKRSGLDPTTFPFDADRPPYPGFAYLEEKDAAVFFGRDAQIVRALDEIRRLARAGVTRMFVILGASGSGKSSFLRAGLWPRLKRDDLAWMPLPIIRPERAAVSGKYGLAEALYETVIDPRFAEGVRQRGLPRSRVDIQDSIEKNDDGLAQFLAALRDIAQAGASGENAPPPTILLAIDQGEELFNEEGRDEARRFIDILTRTLAADPRALVILVMRSDAFPLVQNEPTLAALPKDTFTLDMMLEGSFRAVIEGPAGLLDPPLTIDPQLTDALLEDISGQDALPLLAFTLRHLYDNTRVDNALTLAGYDKIGRVKGVIAQTVEQAYAEAVAKGEAPKDKEERLKLARSAFIPHLAQVNPAGQFVRRVSPRDKIPPEARPLIDRFAEQRLLIRDRRQDAEVIEVAHEALLRQPPFSDWLAEDREFLLWRDRLTQARTAFEADERGLLAGRELAIARSYLQTRAEREFEPADLAFIRNSVAADDKRRSEEAEEQRKREAAEKEEQERRLRDAERIAEEQGKAAAAQKRFTWAASVGLVIAVLVAAVAVWQYFKASEATAKAEANFREAAARFLVGRAVSNESTELSQGLRVRALLAAESLRKAWTNEGYGAWRRATLLMPRILGSIQTDSLFIRMVFTPDSKRLFALCGDRHIHVLSVPDLRELHKVQASETAFELAVDAKGERALAYQADDESVELFDIASGSKRTVFLHSTLRLAAFNPGGEAIVASLTNLWVVDASDKVASRAAFPESTSDVTMSPNGATALARSGKVVGAYDTASGILRWEVRATSKEEWRDAVFSGDGQSLMIKGVRTALIVNTTSGETIKSIPLKPELEGRLVLFNGERYALGNQVYSVGEGQERTLPFRDKPSAYIRLPVVSPSGRYVAGTLQSHEGEFATVDVWRKIESVQQAEEDSYVTLKEGTVAKAATFSPDSELLAVSSDAQDFGPHSGDLQLISLKRELWSPIIPSRSRTGDFAVAPRDARVVVQKETPSPRIYDSGGALLEGMGTGSYFSASGRFAARLEGGKQWIIADIDSKRDITVPANGSPIEFSPDERQVLVFPNIYRLENPGSPQALAATQPLYRTWSYPGANLVIGLYGDQITQGVKGSSVLFDWATGKVSTGPGSINSLYAVSPDGRHFASYDFDAISLWTVGDSKPTVRSPDRTTVDDPLYFSPDGALLAVASCTNPRVFNTRTLELSFRIPMRGCFAGFSAAGKYVVSRWWIAGFPEPTRHPITLDGVLEETCAKVQSNLTAREWEEMGATAFAVATCPEAAVGTSGNAAPSK